MGWGLGSTTLRHWQPGEFLPVAHVTWVPQLGLSYYLAADGISLTLVLLTGIAATAGILFSWNIEKRTQEFFAFYLVLIGGVYGVFLSFDLVLLFVFYEIAIIPKYFLIAIWGSVPHDATGENAGSQREYAAMKLALYSFAGSALVLAGMVAAWVASGGHSMSFDALTGAHFSTHLQMGLFPLVFLGFAVLAGMWPFHTWAPTGHAAAPTAASMLLAGVVMKLGAYGCLRVAMMLFPAGMDPWGFHVLGFGSWRDVFAVLALIGIVYGASVALVQRDFKFVIGYSSVSHMGFVLLGLMTLTQIGLDGAVLQMFSHGSDRGPAVRRGRAHGLRPHPHARSERAGTHAAGTRDSVCCGDVHPGRDGVDWAAGIQRLRCGISDPDRDVAGICVDDHRRRRGHSDRHRVHMARADEGVLWRADAGRCRTCAAADHHA